MLTADPVQFRGRFGHVLAWAVAALCAAPVVLTALDDAGTALRLVPGLALVVVAVWLLYARPAVVVHDGGVELRNVTRTIHLAWPAIRRVDTKYALTLETAYGDYSAWAAPAPSRSTTRRATGEDTRHLPESTYVGGAVRPGDLAGTASGDAAAYIRRRLDDLRDAGHLDDPVLEHDRPTVRWHVRDGVLVAALALLTVAVQRL